MNNILTTATLNWFNDGCCDVIFLDLWDKSPLYFHSGLLDDNSWHYDHYEHLIGHDPSGQLFNIAADHLLNYRFYPTTIISPTSDFSLNQRRAQLGDRIIQRIHLFQLFGYPILDVIAMTEVTELLDTPRQAILGYTTVDTHVEQGQWCASVEWQNDNSVTLSISAISRPVGSEPKRNYGYMRSMQKYAHQQGIDYFMTRVKQGVRV